MLSVFLLTTGITDECCENVSLLLIHIKKGIFVVRWLVHLIPRTYTCLSMEPPPPLFTLSRDLIFWEGKVAEGKSLQFSCM